MKPYVWDRRASVVGEGPVATGVNHEKIYWVSIYDDLIYWRDLITDEVGQIPTGENVSFVLPRHNGGVVVGTANGPYLLDSAGQRSPLPTRSDCDGPDPIPMRWNDAKVGPHGEIWMGTSAYGAASERIGLHRISADGKKIDRILSNMGLSNGLDWSPDGKIFYLIDTVALTLYAFDYFEGEISNQRVAMKFDEALNQYPDGMTVDGDGCLWIAFWNGGCIRKYSPQFQLIDQIEFPVRFVASCAFAGADLKTLVVTTAIGDNGWHDEHELAGMTFLVDTDSKGKAPYVYNSKSAR